MSNTTVIYKRSFPLLTILVLIFMTLKLCGVINWSWWLVFMPWIAPIGLVIGLVGIIATIGLLVEHKDKK